MAKYESIVYISKLLQDGTINDLSKKISTAERTAADISKRLAELESARIAKRAEAERLARETAAAEEAAKVQPQTEEAVVIEEPKAEIPVQPEEPVKQPEPEVVPEKPVEAEAKKPETPEAKPQEEKKEAVEEKPQPVKPARPSYIVAKAPATPPKTYVNKEAGGRSARPAYNQQPRTGAPSGQSRGGAKFVAPATPQPAKPAGKNFGADKKKQNFEKTYVEKDRHAISKRALAKQQGATVADFDEDKSGYRKLRVKKAKSAASSQTIKIDHAVVTTNDIPLKVLSEKIGMSAVEITTRLQARKDGGGNSQRKAG